MHRSRVITQEEIMRDLELLDELNSGESEKSDSEEEEYVLPESNNSDEESDDGSADETETPVLPSIPIKPAQKRGRGSTDVSNGVDKKRPRKSSSCIDIPYVGEEEISPDGTLWRIRSPSVTVEHCAAQNVVKETQGPTSYAMGKIYEGSALSAWRLIFSDEMTKHIKECTEEEAHRSLSNNSWTVSVEELEAAFAIMYARGLCGAKNTPVETLWSAVWGPPVFSQTMPRDRFKEILCFLRFDHKAERSERLKTDKFALASSIWYPFIKNSASCYKPGMNLTVDEQLLSSKAKCPFTQYIPSKRDKFGIRFWLLVCADSKYVVNGFPYTGAEIDQPANQAAHEDVVMKLSQPYLGKGRTITTDSYFTTVKLCEKLKAQATSLVGTIKRNSREVPPTAKLGKQAVYSTIVFQKDKNITLTAYQENKHKNVLMLSSLHNTVVIDNESEKKRPDTIAYYNETKHGVDIVDQMIRPYSTKSASRSWPMYVFFNILDISAMNAWILYNEVTEKKKMTRRNFILRLCDELRGPYVGARDTAIKITPTHPISTIKNELSIIEEDYSGPQKRSRCKVKASCNGNNTMKKCIDCKKSVCGKCAFRGVLCIICSRSKNSE